MDNFIDKDELKSSLYHLGPNVRKTKRSNTIMWLNTQLILQTFKLTDILR